MGIKRWEWGLEMKPKGKMAFHGPVMIYLRPKTKEKMGKDFLTWGQEVVEYIRQKE